MPSFPTRPALHWNQVCVRPRRILKLVPTGGRDAFQCLSGHPADVLLKDKRSRNAAGPLHFFLLDDAAPWPFRLPVVPFVDKISDALRRLWSVPSFALPS